MCDGKDNTLRVKYCCVTRTNNGIRINNYRNMRYSNNMCGCATAKHQLCRPLPLCSVIGTRSSWQFVTVANQFWVSDGISQHRRHGQAGTIDDPSVLFLVLVLLFAPKNYKLQLSLQLDLVSLFPKLLIHHFASRRNGLQNRLIISIDIHFTTSSSMSFAPPPGPPPPPVPPGWKAQFDDRYKSWYEFEIWIISSLPDHRH